MSERIVGRNAVREMLRAGQPVNKVLVAEGSEGAAIADILSLCRGQRVPVQRVPRPVLDKLGSHHQGVAAEVASRAYAELDDLLAAAAQSGRPPFLIVLDGVQDPQNLGAILRTAEAAGAHGVVITRHRAAGLTPAVDRAAAGASAYLPVARVTNLSQALKDLEAAGLWTIGADEDAPGLIYQADFTLPLALVLGGEGKGLSRLVAERCSQLVRLPMFGRVGSLNVSAAAAVLCYEVVRQRQFIPGHFLAPVK